MNQKIAMKNSEPNPRGTMDRLVERRANLIAAAKQLGKLEIVRVPELAAPRVKSLAQACADRGLDPKSYRTPHQLVGKRLSSLDRVIPGVPDSMSPGIWLSKHHGANYHGNARIRYTHQAAANDREKIEQGGVEAYVAAFNRLNNLKD